MYTQRTAEGSAGDRREALRDARIALRSAWYDAVLQLTDGCEDWPGEDAERAVEFKADVLVRRNPVAGLEYLTGIADIPVGEAARFAYDVLCGRAFALIRDFDSAAARFAAAASLAPRVPDGDATIAFHQLRLRWMQRQYDPYAPEFATALAHGDLSMVAAATMLRGWHHGSLGDYRAQIDDFIAALGYMDRATPEHPIDVYNLSLACYGLARTAFEIGHENGVRVAQRAYDTIAWTSDVAANRFQAVRSLAWDAFMRGESGRAQWMLKEAREVAPTDAFRVGALLDRAYVARIAGNEAWALDELAEADRLAHAVAWEATYGEERILLCTLATLNAPVDAARAQRWAASFARLGTESIAPDLAASGDRRATAMHKYAQGRIDQMLGRREPAVAALREAYGIFESVGYHYRAALAAVALADVTGEGVWRERALDHVRVYPNCPLFAMAQNAGSADDAMPAQLSPLQRQIARALWSGSDAADMSRRFSRSRFTIDRQIEAVFDAFGVASRAELTAAARNRGMT